MPIPNPVPSTREPQTLPRALANRSLRRDPEAGDLLPTALESGPTWGISTISGLEMLEASGGAALIVDPSGTIVFCNSASEALQRRQRSEIVGEPLGHFSTAASPVGPGSDAWACLVNGNHWSGDVSVRRGDGTEVPAHVTRSPLFASDGTVVGILSLAADRTREFDAMQALQASEQQLRSLAEDLSRQALTDPLTSLPNRALLGDRLSRALTRLSREGSLVAVMFLDVDKFKAINDTYGHHGGDAVLSAVGERLSHQVRATDTVARVGGDEFVVVFEDVTDQSQVVSFGNRLVAAVGVPVEIEGHAVTTSVSIGATITTDPRVSPSNLVRNADIAMYEAKERGGNCCVFYEPGMRPSIVPGLDQP
ncbi:MAG: diguanylate cyclase domain-containing protein [Acidimicrobiales bacterium]